MNSELKVILWQQFGATIDMLENAIEACPDEVWGDRSRNPEYWYLAYHTLFWLDLYLQGPVEGFRPPAPYGLEELDPAGLLPDRVYTKAEMLDYLRACREKCRVAIAGLTAQGASKRHTFGWGEVSYLERLLYNMRHVQHHAAQLNLILRQRIDSAPGWVGITKRPLDGPGGGRRGRRGLGAGGPTMFRALDQFDARFSGWMARHGVRLLRISVGVVFLWFGFLKFFPGMSPAQGLATDTIRVMTFGAMSPEAARIVLAAWETVVGLGLFFGVFLRATLFLLWLQMLGTLTPLFFFPDLCFTRFPYAPTMEGQYIIKNFVLISAGLVIGATVRRERQAS